MGNLRAATATVVIMILEPAQTAVERNTRHTGTHEANQNRRQPVRH
jgi:hypothetical protein